MEKQTFELEVSGKKIEVNINNLAEQANGSVFVRCGDTIVMATSCMSKEQKKDMGFFPLTVNYEEKFYAAGKIYGSRYVRREGRPSNKALITTRMIDRTIRPLFPQELRKEVQVIVTCLSWDEENSPDILAILAASLSLHISDIPWQGPVAPIRISRKEGKVIINPVYEQREGADFDIVFSGVENTVNPKEPLVNMFEIAANETDEGSILKALEVSNDYFKGLLAFQEKIRKEVGKEKIEIAQTTDPELERVIQGFLNQKIEQALSEESNNKMGKVDALKDSLLALVEERYSDEPEKVEYAARFFDDQVNKEIHKQIIENNRRPDGRGLDETRKLSCETGLLPRTHGSAIFCRGKTKSLSILTLGAPGDRQVIEGMEIVGEKRFMHHYNFPPSSVGEVRPLRGPGRRDIGHGILAEKAIEPLLPDSEEFPYTIRIVSEILCSNGSTSMASTTSSSLALMDAGVPIKRPVTGIAIGLMQNEQGKYKVLTDIQGPEDHYGDMDFKVAGTSKGICAMQMDVKNRGINKEIFKKALEQAKKSRLHILEEIKKTIDGPRSGLSPFAPKILTIRINPEKIGELIGPKGKTINEITKETGVAIDIQESGLVFVTSKDKKSAERAIGLIGDITKEIKVGEIFNGKVKKVLDFGAFVQITPRQEGLIHISKLAPHHVDKVEDVVRVDDVVLVKVISIDEQGRINLSLEKKGDRETR